MEPNVFIKFCEEKFKYLIEEYGFKISEENDEQIKPFIILEKKNLKIKIKYQVIEVPSFPIATDLIVTEKKLFGKFLSQEKKCELDDLLIYLNCPTIVYDYLDYSNIKTFYEAMTEEACEFYGEKYSKDSEVLILLDKYAYLLKNHGSDILNGDLRTLTEVREMREKYDKKYNCFQF